MSLFSKDKKKTNITGIKRVRGKVVTDVVRGIITVGEWTKQIKNIDLLEGFEQSNITWLML